MQKRMLVCYLLCCLMLVVSGCEKDDTPVQTVPTDATQQTVPQQQQTTDPSVFNGDQPTTAEGVTDPSMLGDTVDLSGNPPSATTGQQPTDNSIPNPGVGTFDSIDNPQGPSVTGDNTAQTGVQTGTDVTNPSDETQTTSPNVTQSPRDQINALVSQWSNTIPKIDIELFKRSNEELTSVLKEQFPMSLRYVWGQPKVKAEPFSGGYRDTWSCSSADNSFSGKIYVQYDGTDETRSSVVSATIEILTDTNGLVNPISTTITTNPGTVTTPTSTTEEPAFADSNPSSVTTDTSTANLALNTVATALGNPATPLAEINAMLEGKTYEDLIIEWGKSDHKDANGYHWKVDQGFVSVMFDASGMYSSAKLTQAS